MPSSRTVKLVLCGADMPMEDLAAVLYDVFDFIEVGHMVVVPLAMSCMLGSRCEERRWPSNKGAARDAQSARSSGGRVLLHCSQGVSRSASLAIAYLMWKRGGAFDEVLAAVKAIRGVANPNIGFTCQARPVRAPACAPLACAPAIMTCCA